MPLAGAQDFMADLMGADMTPDISAERLGVGMPPLTEPVMPTMGYAEIVPEVSAEPPMDFGLPAAPPPPGLGPDPLAGDPMTGIQEPPLPDPNEPPPVSSAGAPIARVEYQDGEVWSPPGIEPAY